MQRFRLTFGVEGWQLVPFVAVLGGQVDFGIAVVDVELAVQVWVTMCTVMVDMSEGLRKEG